jgi:hypothetical protein
MVQQHLINFSRRDFFAAAIDNLFKAAIDEQIAVLIKIALIPVRNQPAVNALAFATALLRNRQ